MAKHNETGKIGERAARHFLTLHGFTICDSNLRIGKKEIDIVAEKDNKIHLVEVKTVREGSSVLSAENMTEDKKENLRTAALLLLEKNVFHGKRIQVDFMAVTLYEKERRAHCVLTQNIEV